MPLNADLKKFELKVPTYYGSVAEERATEFGLPEFDEPAVPVLIHEAEGVRIVLGTHDYDDLSKPDIQIERRPKGWAVFLHPEPGGDASGFVYFLDDGRSFVLPEFGENAIQWLDRGDIPPGIDEVDGPVPDLIAERRSPSETQKMCKRCKTASEYSGDWYGDLCPECADKTEGAWTCRICGRQDNFEAMGGGSATNPSCCGSTCIQISLDELDE